MTNAVSWYAVLAARLTDWLHCAVLPLSAAPASAKVPECACPVTTLSELSQVQPDRFPVSKPGLDRVLVAAEAPGMASPTRARAAAERLANATMRPGLRTGTPRVGGR